ncbi:MAG: GNAT family N-acetyltransferase [Kiritimatiellae bacterium]|nr:GNAT family N-acetyltransferase [Verrucomicrobiota bacterium]MCG2681322.1 GNAT family N-acetyltransferase [Kiritimatiellia bacterium]
MEQIKPDILPVSMVCEKLDNIPQHQLPAPYSLRWFKKGDEKIWFDIQMVICYYKVSPDLFAQEFGNDFDELSRRQLFLCDAAGKIVGTATAWFNPDYRGRPYGRIHWVGILPEVQGQGLAKPLMSKVMERFVELGHERVYLTTSTLRIPAIRLYLKFGFVPEINSQQDKTAWRSIELFFKKKMEVK